MEKITGILNIDKPAGITSYDVCDIFKKIFNTSKIGHTGTLDPLATGVLPVLIGEACKLSEMLTSDNKAYRVKMLLGVETNTFDIQGKIVFASVVDKDDIYIRERIKRFIGKQMQTPPAYSAIRVEGKHAYQLAREGKQIDIKPREIEVFDINNISVDIQKKEVTYDVYCSKGTYVRSLVNDMGKKIGCGATLLELTRMKTGNFDIKNSIPLYDFLKLNFEQMKSKLITIEECFFDEKKYIIDKKMLKPFLNGVLITVDEPDKLVRVYMENKYIGIGTIKNKQLKRYIVEVE